MDVIAFGGCYLDINTAGFLFDDTGLPVETELRADYYKALPGGSAVNFCRRLTELGVSSTFIGMRGDDAVGDVIEHMLRAEGLTTDLLVAPGRRTNVSMSLVSEQGSHVTVGAGNANQALTVEQLMLHLAQHLPKTRYLYMGTCYKLSGLLPQLSAIAVQAQRAGAQVIVDHGRYTDKTTPAERTLVRELVLGADLYVPSRQEFLLTWEVSSIQEGLRLLQREAPSLTVVLKDGKAGAHYLRDNTVVTIPGVNVSRAYNLTGAGDTFNAGLLSGLLTGLDLEKAIEKGCAVAADHISKEVK